MVDKRFVGANSKRPSDATDIETAERLVKLLNEILKIDPIALACLITNRVPANMLLTNHPTVQTFMDGNGFTVGLLGILNGLCGVTADGFGHITAVYSDEPTPTLLRFALNEPSDG